jgi:two-component system, NarL family, response regulator NreC
VTSAASVSRSPAYLQPSFRVTRYSSGLPTVVYLGDGGVVFEALRKLLTGRTETVATATGGAAAVAVSELVAPDVVVVAELLDDGAAEQFVPALLHTGARVLMLTRSRETPGKVDLVALGVTGLVDQHGLPQEAADAVLILAGGGAVLPPDVVSAVATDWRRSLRHDRRDDRTSDLTSREREVLGAVSDGLSTKAVAHHLGISVKTVENHKTRIFDKLGVRSQAEATAVALASPGVMAISPATGTAAEGPGS